MILDTAVVMGYIALIFKFLYFLLVTHGMYFITKFLVIWLSQGFNIKRKKVTTKFFWEYFLPLANAIRFSVKYWYFLHSFSSQFVTIFSVLFIIGSIIWLYYYPLDLSRIKNELSFFIIPTFYFIKLTIILSICLLVFIIARAIYISPC